MTTEPSTKPSVDNIALYKAISSCILVTSTTHEDRSDLVLITLGTKVGTSTSSKLQDASSKANNLRILHEPPSEQAVKDA